MAKILVLDNLSDKGVEVFFYSIQFNGTGIYYDYDIFESAFVANDFYNLDAFVEWITGPILPDEDEDYYEDSVNDYFYSYYYAIATAFK